MELVTLHLTVLGITALVIMYADYVVVGYVRGTREVLAWTYIGWVHRLIWMGLVGMISMGVALAVPLWRFLLVDPVFYLKIGFVLTLCINGFFIKSVLKKATTSPFMSLLPDERKLLYMSGTHSVICWTGAACIGFFFL